MRILGFAGPSNLASARMSSPSQAIRYATSATRARLDSLCATVELWRRPTNNSRHHLASNPKLTSHRKRRVREAFIEHREKVSSPETVKTGRLKLPRLIEHASQIHEQLPSVCSNPKLASAVHFSPTPHLFQDRSQSPPFGREEVFRTRWMGRIEPASHDAVGLEFLESCGQHAGSESRKSSFKVVKATIPMQKKFAQDQNAPAVANNVESFGYRTVEIVFSCH